MKDKTEPDQADQAAKGQSSGDPWQISTDIVMGLSHS